MTLWHTLIQESLNMLSMDCYKIGDQIQIAIGGLGNNIISWQYFHDQQLNPINTTCQPINASDE
jgi:hypothetical protein